MQGLVLFRVFCAVLFGNVRCVKASEYEIPQIMSNITWNTTLSSGDVLSYYLCIGHAMSSPANASNLRLRWMYSNQLKFQTFHQNVGPNITVHIYPSFVDVEIKLLSRKQQVCWDVVFVFNLDMSFCPGRHVVTTYAQLSWDDRAISGRRYTNHWKTLSRMMEVSGCSDMLGIAGGSIRDHQMTSSSYVIGKEPFKARLNNTHGWCAAVLDDTQFLQVDFIYEVKIIKLLVQGLSMRVGVELFFLEYSMDDKNWKNYTEYGMTRVFHHTLGNNLSSVHWLAKPFKAYNVRLRPTRWNVSICLKLELYGCEDLKTKASCIFPLGMESGFITNAALSTSLENGNPYDSRLGKKGKEYGGWLANPFASQDYLQIDLAVLYSFTKIAVQGSWSGMANSFVSKYTVMISNDSLVWQNYTENGKLKVFDGPISSLAAIYPTFVKLAEPVATRYIRILPQKQTDGYHRVMRLEVYGCLTEPMPSYRVPYDFSRRSYLLNNLTGHFYVCLYSDDRHESSCQYTVDGYTWKKMNRRIVKVLGIDSSDFVLYGLDRSNSYLRGTGNDWTVISPKQWGRVKVSRGVMLAKDVPENLLREDHNGGEILETRNGYKWTVSHTGIHMKSPGGNWIVAATWKC